jgi:hypothetical protein
MTLLVIIDGAATANRTGSQHRAGVSASGIRSLTFRHFCRVRTDRPDMEQREIFNWGHKAKARRARIAVNLKAENSRAFQPS